jgi:hypothetical protein
MSKEMQFAGDYQLENILVHAPSTNGSLDIKGLMLELILHVIGPVLQRYQML